VLDKGYLFLALKNTVSPVVAEDEKDSPEAITGKARRAEQT
jgi:hypothetical protein